MGNFFEPLVSYRFILSLIFTAMFGYGLFEAWMTYRNIYTFLEQNYGRYRLHRVFAKTVRYLAVGAPLWRFWPHLLAITVLCAASLIASIEAWRLSH